MADTDLNHIFDKANSLYNRNGKNRQSITDEVFNNGKVQKIQLKESVRKESNTRNILSKKASVDLASSSGAVVVSSRNSRHIVISDHDRNGEGGSDDDYYSVRDSNNHKLLNDVSSRDRDSTQ